MYCVHCEELQRQLEAAQDLSAVRSDLISDMLSLLGGAAPMLDSCPASDAKDRFISEVEDLIQRIDAWAASRPLSDDP